MRFLHEPLLVWGLLAVAALALYLFRRRPRTVRVSTLPFFKSLAREHQESAWLRRLKRLLSLLLSILVILLAVGALAQLVVSPPAESLSTVVVLVDRSASMAARGDDGRTRLDDALARLRTRLAGLPGGIGVTVMAYDRRPEVLLPRSLDRREVQRALDGITVRPIAGDEQTALAMARRFAALEPPAAVWHATDHEPQAESEEETSDARDETTTADETEKDDSAAGDVEVVPLNVALSKPVNVGITAFQLSRVPLAAGNYEAFVQVHCSAPKALEAELEVRFDGNLSQIRQLPLEPGGRQRLLIPVDGKRAKTLSLRLKAPGDVLNADDQLHAVIPEFRPVRVQWYSEAHDPFLEIALRTFGPESGIEVLRGGPDNWPPKTDGEAAPDVLLLDGWLPDEWPKDVSVVAIDPPRASGPVRAVRLQGEGLPLESVRAAMAHPLLYGVATDRVQLTQTAVLDSTGPLQPLWVGDSGAVLVAGEVQGQRIVVAGFSPAKSTRLPLLASFPLLVGNAIYWAAQPREAERTGNNRRTGELVEVSGETITWSTPEEVVEEETVALAGRWAELDRLGLWKTDGGQSGSAALLAAEETLLAQTGSSSENSQQSADETQAASWLQGDLSALLVWLVAAILLVESWLFHRHGVH